ncbi:MAG: hypothetical protein FWG81_00670 [Betaproteobacteria bacterium]|nr:hypothetical protein [Betaproteobacteria bacterium]
MKKVLTLYCGWSMLWLDVAFFGHGEYDVSVHLILIFTGLPLALLSLQVPNGTVPGVAVAGAIGTIQWCAVAELNRRWDLWQNARKN